MSTLITVAYGDGIGPEIMEAVLSILREAEAEISIDIIEIGSVFTVKNGLTEFLQVVGNQLKGQKYY